MGDRPALTPPCVALTRPLDESRRLAALLSRVGYQCLIAPMLALEATAMPCPHVSVDGIVITSGNIFKILDGRALAPYAAMPCYCVGAATAEAARRAGFLHVVAGDGDAEALAARMVASSPPRHVLHIAGEHRAGEPWRVLERAGWSVTPWVVYRAVLAEGLPAAMDEALRSGALDAVLFFSSRTAMRYDELVRKAGLGACCARLGAIGLSDAVAGALQEADWGRIIRADRPTEDAMLAALKAHYPVAARSHV